MEASGLQSKIGALKNGEYSFLPVPLCCRGNDAGLRLSKLSGELILLDPPALSCLLYTSAFAQLLEEPDSVTVQSHSGLALLQMHATIPRKLPVSKGIISDSLQPSVEVYLV